MVKRTSSYELMCVLKLGVKDELVLATSINLNYREEGKAKAAEKESEILYKYCIN